MEKEKLVFKPHSEKHRMYLQDEDTDIILIGGGAGSGKSYQSVLKSLKYIQDSAARIQFMRETMPKITCSGGLFDESKNIYPYFKGKSLEKPPAWRFKNGARVDYKYIPKSIGEVQGWQLTNLFIDEATEFPMDIVLAAHGRLRSGRFTQKRNMTMTCNPSRYHFLFDWVSFCLDDEGIPKPGTEDVIRYFCNIGGKLSFGYSPLELFEEYGKPRGMTFGVDFKVTSFRFIPMTIKDNPVLLENDPEYIGKLLANDRVEQLRLLHGSWTAVPDKNTIVSRKCFDIVEELPPLVAHCRAYDLAASRVTETEPNPDWTCGVRLAKGYDGFYYVIDVIRYRDIPTGVMEKVVGTGKNDPEGQPIVIVQDPGAAGKAYLDFMMTHLAERGLYACKSNQNSTSSKLNRFKPFATIAGERKVRLLRGDWNEDFLVEIEGFDGVDTRGKKDDQVDAVATAFNFLCQNTILPQFSIPTDFNYKPNTILPRL